MRIHRHRHRVRPVDLHRVPIREDCLSFRPGGESRGIWWPVTGERGAPTRPSAAADQCGPVFRGLAAPDSRCWVRRMSSRVLEPHTNRRPEGTVESGPRRCQQASAGCSPPAFCQFVNAQPGPPEAGRHINRLIRGLQDRRYPDHHRVDDRPSHPATRTISHICHGPHHPHHAAIKGSMIAQPGFPQAARDTSGVQALH